MGFWPDEEELKPIENRRRGPDNLVQYIRFSSFLTWVFLLLVIVLYDAAQPSQFNIYVIDERWGKTTETFIRTSYMNASAALCVFTFCFALINLILDSRRARRRNDRYSFALITALVFSFVGLIWFAVYYLAY